MRSDYSDHMEYAYADSEQEPGVSGIRCINHGAIGRCAHCDAIEERRQRRVERSKERKPMREFLRRRYKRRRR